MVFAAFTSTRSQLFLRVSGLTGYSKSLIPGCSKRSSCEAREKSTSEGVFTDTLERGDRAQRSRWAFFNSLLTFLLYVDSLSRMPFDRRREFEIGYGDRFQSAVECAQDFVGRDRHFVDAHPDRV